MKFNTKVSLFLFAMFLNYTANAGSGDEMDLDSHQNKIENNNTIKRKKFKINNKIVIRAQNKATKRTLDEFYDDSDESFNELSLYNDGCYKSNTNIIKQVNSYDEDINTKKTKKHDSHHDIPEIELEQGLQNANTNEHETNFADELTNLMGNIYIDFGNGNTNGSYVEGNFKKSFN